MVATEIFLIAAGVICVVVSVVMSFGDDKENVESSAKSELTQAQLDMVKHQVDEVIKQQISGLSEKTEAALDKISNTKILEMNEYAGAKILGSVTIGDNCKIGAGSVVLKDVPANSTVVGVPGRVVIQDSVRLFDDLDQIHLPDPVMQDIENLKQENARLKKRLAHLENSVNESRSSYDDN